MQINLQGQKEDLLLAEERGYITKGHRETFGGGGYIHNPDFGDGVTGVYLPMSKLIKLYFKYVQSVVHLIYFSKAENTFLILEKKDLDKEANGVHSIPVRAVNRDPQ